MTKRKNFAEPATPPTPSMLTSSLRIMIHRTRAPMASAMSQNHTPTYQVPPMKYQATARTPRRWAAFSKRAALRGARCRGGHRASCVRVPADAPPSVRSVRVRWTNRSWTAPPRPRARPRRRGPLVGGERAEERDLRRAAQPLPGEHLPARGVALDHVGRPGEADAARADVVGVLGEQDPPAVDDHDVLEETLDLGDEVARAGWCAGARRSPRRARRRTRSGSGRPCRGRPRRRSSAARGRRARRPRRAPSACRARARWASCGRPPRTCRGGGRRGRRPSAGARRRSTRSVSRALSDSPRRRSRTSWVCIVAQTFSNRSSSSPSGPTRTVPDVGRRNAASRAASVVLPAPLRPSRPVMTPGRIVRVAPSSAGSSPREYRTTTSRTSAPKGAGAVAAGGRWGGWWAGRSRVSPRVGVGGRAGTGCVAGPGPAGRGRPRTCSTIWAAGMSRRSACASAGSRTSSKNRARCSASSRSRAPGATNMPSPRRL